MHTSTVLCLFLPPSTVSHSQLSASTWGDPVGQVSCFQTSK
jgi:hypothetical protein